VRFGSAGDLPVAGDLNGDGLADLATYRPSTGIWRFDVNRDGLADLQFKYGEFPQDTPLLADIDLDGKADPIIYRDGLWFVDLRQDGGPPDRIFSFGGAGARPFVAAVGGDFTAPALGAFRDGYWEFDRDLDGRADTAYSYGGPGDRPLVGAIDRSRSLFVTPLGSDGNGGGFEAPLRSVGRAVQLAAPGTIIRVAAGTYAENVEFFGKTDLTFVGAGQTATRLRPAAGDAFLSNSSTGITLAKLGLIGGEQGLPGRPGRGLAAVGSTIAAHDVRIRARVAGVEGAVTAAIGGRPNRLTASYTRFDGSAGDGLELQGGSQATLASCSFSAAWSPATTPSSASPAASSPTTSSTAH
jgi:hypothetical protein